MKKLFYISMFAFLLVLVGCGEEDLATGNKSLKGIQVTLEEGASMSRMAVGEANALTWTEGDAFSLLTDGVSCEWTLEGEGGSSTGTFKGADPSGVLKGAVYPASEEIYVSDNVLTMKLASELEYSENGKCNLPMWASVSSLDEGISFKHLGALLKVKFTDIPVGYNKLTVSANKPLSGTFTADLTLAEPVLVASGTEVGSVNVSFEAIVEGDDNDRVFYIPLPVGEYGYITVSLSDGTSNLKMASWMSKTIVRKKVYVASLTYKSTDVTTPTEVTSFLNEIEPTSEPVVVDLTCQVEATNDAITIPAVSDGSSNVTLNFTEIPVTSQEKPLSIAEETTSTASTTANKLTVDIPTSENTDVGTYLVIDVPTTTVTISGGSYAQITATTAPSTLIVGEGVVVNNLDIVADNVIVYGTVTGSITRNANNTDEVTYVTVMDGASIPQIDDDKIVVGYSTQITFANKELSKALYNVLGPEKVNFNADSCAVMSESDVLAVNSLNFGWDTYTITSLAGIENFVNLQTLECSGTGLAKCDLSKNLALRNVTLCKNQLTTLDLSNLTELIYVGCAYSENLTDLILTGCTKLEHLECMHSPLEAINIPNPSNMDQLIYGGNKDLVVDLSLYTNLKKLGIKNMGLTELNIPDGLKSQLTYLVVDEGNQLTSLDLSEYPNLEMFGCGGNNITTLDLSNVPNLWSLDCWGNQLTTLDISGLSKLTNLYCGNQQNDGLLTLTLTETQKATWDSTWNTQSPNVTLNVLGSTTAVTQITFANKELSKALYAVLGADRVSFDADSCAVMSESDVLNVASLDFGWDTYTITSLAGIENFVNLQTLYCNGTGLAECDLSKNVALRNVVLCRNKLTTLDLSNLTELIYVGCAYSENLKELVLTSCTKLEHLECMDTPLEAINIPNPENMHQLIYGGNKDLVVDLSLYPNLKILGIMYMGLTELDIPENLKSQLTDLFVDNGNQLTSLDLSEYPNLETLSCGGNNLTSLNLSAVPNLWALNCWGNQLTTLDISGLSKLTNLSCGYQQNDVVLELTLTEAQKITWDDKWSAESGNVNVNVCE